MGFVPVVCKHTLFIGPKYRDGVNYTVISVSSTCVSRFSAWIKMFENKMTL